jgi:hypothetical protein
MPVDLVAHLDEVNKVAEEYIKGNDETAISKNLAIPRQRVVNMLNEWRDMVSSNEAIRIRAKEALAGADKHFSVLIQKAYEVIDEATMNGNLGAKTNAIKLVMDIEKTRIEQLQKAGLLENKELADELIETERKQEVLVGILRDVSGECPKCRSEVARRLANVAGPTEVITVDIIT